jgi:NADPH:quinone reductase-like Zn-dependent oxidoreductase/acyl carrier protein
LITQGSQIANSEDKIVSIESTAGQGLGRLIGNELPAWKIRLIDFEESNNANISKEEWRVVLHKMYASGRPFEEIAVRQNKVYRKGIKKWNTKDSKQSFETVQFQDTGLELVSNKFKSLDDLRFSNADRAEPKIGEIEISVENTSINFKDYLKVSGKIALEALEGTYGEGTIGLDCAGVVTKLGKGVSKFKVGDKVIAIAPGTFRSYTITSEHLAVKCPKNLVDFESHVVSSYLTALYCLRDKANLRKGDKILIHSATGGVGLAAINYANLIGAEIYATAESIEKRNYLRSIGIEHVYNSRSLDFSKEIMETTDGKGVDVILSALPKEMLHQSLATLAPYGTYLEIGIKDIIDDSSLPMAFFNKNISYISVDLDRMIKEKQKTISKLLDDLSRYIENDQLKPLSIKVFNPAQISEAFKLVEDGLQIGKVIVDFKNQSIDIERKQEALFKTDKSYLITGGTKGLGLEIAKWLVDNGVKNLALLSRSGLKDPYAKKVVYKMKRNGVNVKVFSADVAELGQMTQIFSQIEEEMPLLAGIFHCAMVLDDGFLMDMNEDRFRKVLRPKIDGAINLHQLTRKLNLDQFILFSSISSLIGNVGQANYIVANTLLDSFANIRKSHGLPATTINLGVLAESGVVSRSENLEMILQGVGIRSFTNKQVLIGLEKILHEKPTQIGFFDLNWELLSSNLKGSGLAIFEDLIKTKVGSNNGMTKDQNECLNILYALKKVDQQEFIASFLKRELSKMLKIPKDKIQQEKGIGFLGIDSILSIELLRVINDKFALKMTSMELLSLPSINQLSFKILENILKAGKSGTDIILN